MSDAKPFAEVDRGDEDDGEDPTMTIGGFVEFYKCDDDSHAEAVERFERYARQINAAVARARREAAAEALEEAAKDADCYAEDTMEHLGHQEGLLADAIRLRVVRWLRTRAAALRKGDG